MIEEQEDLTDYVLNQSIRLNPGKPWHRPEKVYRTRLVVASDTLPALGYTRWHLDFSADGAVVTKTDNERTIENAAYRIEVESSGLLAITHKASGKRYTRQMEFVENGDDGDSYNYSPPRQDMHISAENSLVSARRNVDGLRQSLTLDYMLSVPADLNDRASGIADRKMPLSATVTLQDDELIRFTVDVDNQVLSHRLCVHFATDIMASVSCADQLFGAITRPVELKESLQVWEAEQWHEKPIAIEPMQSYVNLHDDRHGFTFHTNGVREYEIVGDNFDTVAVTLFRSFSHMGKTDLLYRPGRASGESVVATPDAQILGPLSFAFSWRIYSGRFDDAQHARVSKTLLTTFPVYQDSDFLNGRLRFCLSDEARDYPETFSLLTLTATASDALVSTIKCAEKNTGYIIRFYNPNLASTVALPALSEARPVMLDEHTSMPERQLLQPGDVQTLYIEMD